MEQHPVNHEIRTNTAHSYLSLPFPTEPIEWTHWFTMCNNIFIKIGENNQIKRGSDQQVEECKYFCFRREEKKKLYWVLYGI